jgi:predicted transcriptional regulator
MAEGSSSHKVNPNLVAEIVSSYLAKNSVAVDQVGGLIAAIYRTLSGLGSAQPTTAPATLPTT